MRPAPIMLAAPCIHERQQPCAHHRERYPRFSTTEQLPWSSQRLTATVAGASWKTSAW